MKRVVVTGLGCITPVGNDVSTFWQSLIDGKHGFGDITKFDATGLKTRIAGEVKDFNPEFYIEKSGQMAAFWRVFRVSTYLLEEKSKEKCG